MFFWNSLAFSTIQWMLAIWSLVPFLKPAWTSGSSQFTYCWSLAWRIWSVTLLACEIVQLCSSLSTLWYCLSLGLEWKLTLSSPAATAEFSKFADILGTYSVQFSSVAQSCPTLCDPMNRSTLGLPVHHQVPQFTQTHVHRVGDAIQPSHPLSSPSLPAPNRSQHQGLFQWVNSSHEVAKVLEFQLQHQSLQWIFKTDLF